MNAIRLVLAAALLLGASPLAHAAPDRAQKARDYFTNTVLVDQDGKDVRFYEDVLKDRVVVIDFIFTRCPSACPLLTQKLLQTRAALAGSADVHFVSISIDPDNDSPAELRAFAKKQGASGPGWTFLTGKKADIQHVVKRLGQWTDAPEDHSTVFIAGNARTNHWIRLRPDSPPKVMAAELQRLAAGGADAPIAAAK